MSLFETFKSALQGLRANALRSILSMLGIIIGVAAVIAVVSIGTGSSELVLANISEMGSNLVTISPSFQRRLGSGATQRFTYELAADIERAVPFLQNVVPQASGNALFVVGAESMNASITGVTPPYQEVMNYKPDHGRFVTEDDVHLERNVIVLGAAIAQELWPQGNPVGQDILLIVDDRRFSFTVIGVMETKGQMLGSGFDNQAYIPITTLMRRLTKTSTVAGYSAQALQAELSAEAVEQVEYFLARRVGEEHFRVTSQEQMVQAINEVSNTLSIMLGGIASIALLVGGIGIMNIMLVSVTERTREIGTRKALGAKRRHILAQFLIEAFTLSAVGGGVGLLLGWGGAAIIASFGGWSAMISLGAVVLAIGFSGAIGLFFGIYPALQAARLDPVQALAYE